MKVTEFFNLVPNSLLDRAVIAGGAAVDFDKAEDVDIWILSHGVKAFSYDHQQSFNDHILKSLGLLYDHLPTVAGLDGAYTETDSDDLENQDYENSGFYVLVNGVYAGKKFQIFATEATTPEALLNEFDLSVHQVAIMSDGTYVVVSTTTKTTEPIRVLNVRDQKSTFRRALKLALRYETHIEWNEGQLTVATAPEAF
jgi:hypothetical protein